MSNATTIKLVTGGADSYSYLKEKFITSKKLTKAENTIAFYRLTLGYMLDWLEGKGLTLSTTTINDLEEWAAEHKPKMKNTTYNHAVTAARVFWNWAVSRNLTDTNIAKEIGKQKADDEYVDPFSDEELQGMFAQLSHKTTFCDHRAYVLCLVLLECGFRITEALNIKMKHLTLDSRGGEIYITAENCKTSKGRTVPFSIHVANELEEYLIRRKPGSADDYLFCSSYGTGQFERHNFVKQLKTIAKKAGIDPEARQVSPHVFRHTFATNYLKNGGDLLSLKRLGGWANTRILERYVKYLNDDLREIQRSHSVVDHLFKKKAADNKPVIKQKRQRLA